MRRLFRLLLLLALAGPAPLPAQTPKVESISIEEGLSQNFVRAICQDKEGFLWITTKNGLNRYDGYDFLLLANDPYDPFSLPNDELYDVMEVCDGDMLCLSTAGGICFYDKKTHRFYLLPQTVEPLHGFTDLLTDGHQTVFALVIEGAKNPLYQLRLPDRLAERLRAGEKIENLVSFGKPFNQVIYSAALTNDGKTLWINNSRDSLLAMDVASGSLRYVPIPGLVPTAMGHAGISADNILWIEWDNKIVRFDPATGQSTVFPMSETFTDMVLSNDRWLWIPDQNTLYGFDLQHLPSAFTPATAAMTVPINAGIMCALEDNYGTIWLGTNGWGIKKFNLRTGIFRNFLPNNSIYSPLVTDPDGNIFIGEIRLPQTPNTTLNTRTGQLSHNSLAQQFFGIYGARATMDDRGRFWMTSCLFEAKLNRLVRYDPATHASKSFDFGFSCSNPFNSMLFVPPNEIWVGQPLKLACFDTETEQLKEYDYNKQCNLCDPVFALAKTADGSIWAALTQGLLRLQRGSGGAPDRITLLRNDPSNRNSLPSNLVKTLLTDPKDPNILWIGTGGGGMARLDTRTGYFTIFNTRNGLPNNVVYGILADPDPSNLFLWMSTNKGLARFNTAEKTFQYFYKSDGLQENEFNTWAYGKTPAGELLFGGVNGITMFNPRDIVPHAQPPAIWITGLKINGHLTSPRDSDSVLSQGIEYAESIGLDYARNNLTIQFAALDYTNPTHNRFQYYLQGLEPEWAHEGFEHSAQYLSLAPGTYTFKVRGCNSDGIWNQQPTILHITVYPPWYRSTLAWLLYLLLLGGGAYALFRFQLKNKLEHAENERLKEIDLAKTRLYTNITHEFRTPLTVILGLTDQLKKEEAAKTGAAKKEASGKSGVTLPELNAGGPAHPLDIIRRNGQNLLALINQMLDLAKLESGQLEIFPIHGDSVAFIRYLVESFESLGAGKNVQLHFLTETEQLQMDYDPEKLQAIVANLLSNAVKFTPAGGHVYLQLRRVEEKNQPHLLLTVRDTGIGIAPEKLPHIFDRFYQADDSATRAGEGTGIGLALVRELVKLMQGKISAGSEPGKGTVFTVSLPVTARALPAAEGQMPQPVRPVLPEISQAWPQPAINGVGLKAEAMEAGSGNAAQPLLLIVEDNADVRQYLADCVRDFYRLAFAENGREGMERAFELAPDLVVSDVMMPEMDGFQLCQILKNDTRTSHLPIVLLTAKADLQSRIEGLTRGADDYIAKPFDRDELLVRLHNLVQLRRRLQARYASMEPLPATDDPDVQIEDAFLQKVRTYLENEIGNARLGVDDLCRAFGMGRTNLHQKFSALTGMSAMQYLRTLRLDKAKKLLASGELNVSEVAYEVGFDDPKYFSRVFSEEIGVPPAQWKRDPNAAR